jgi:hypothetical protein
MVIAAHPTSNANVRCVLEGLSAAGLLEDFQTTIAAFPSGFWYRVSSLPGLGEIRRRSYDDDLRLLVRTAPMRDSCQGFEA